MSWLAICLTSALLGSGAPEEDPPVPVSGRVVDEQGRPVAGAAVAQHWMLDGGEVPSARLAMVTDADGRFDGEQTVYRFPLTLSAFTADGALAGSVTAGEDEVGDLLLSVAPTVRVRARLSRPEDEPALESVSLSLRVDRLSVGAQGLAPAAPGEPVELAALLPRGQLSWMAYDSDFSMLSGEQALEPEHPQVDLGWLRLPQHFLAGHVGERLPDWTVSDARGVELENATIAAHRGQWLLIEFWGFW